MLWPPPISAPSTKVTYAKLKPSSSDRLSRGYLRYDYAMDIYRTIIYATATYGIIIHGTVTDATVTTSMIIFTMVTHALSTNGDISMLLPCTI